MNRSNFSNENSSQSHHVTSLDELLDSLGFTSWKTVTSAFVLPVINIMGLVFCSLSARVFFQKKFVSPVFFYYRLLTVVYILSLLHNIPFGLLFSPRYLLVNVNTYAIAVYLVYYEFVANLLFHYGDVLRICIMLTRMKIFSPFVKKFFRASPKQISLLCLIICFLIDIPILFGLTIDSFGKYVYFEASSSDDKKVQKIAKFYYLTSSQFGKSLAGEIILAITDLTLNILLSLVVSVALNISFYIHYKLHLLKRTREAAKLRANTPFEIKFSTRVDEETVEWNRKVINERKAEKNMIHMLVTLCSISILTRVLLLFSYFYFIFYHSFSLSLTLTTIIYSIYTFVPTVSVVVFYSFNKLFREEFKNTFLWTKTNDSLEENQTWRSETKRNNALTESLL